MLRWTIRIAVAFVVLILVFAVAVHFVLRSEWLAERILARASAWTGLEITAESLSIGWGGSTVVREVAVRIPATDEVVAGVDRIELAHQIVPLLILGRPITVRFVEVDDPNINLRRDETGRWNVQEAWARIAAGLKLGDRQNGRAALPQVLVRDAWIRVVEPNEIARTLGPLSLQARPEGEALWQFDVQLAPGTEALTARLIGQWDRLAQAGELSGSWAIARPEEAVRSHGTCQALVKSPRAGRKEAGCNVTAQAETSFGTWNVIAEVQGGGADWQSSQWQIALPTFLWSGNQEPLDLAGATAEIDLDWPTVRLASLDLPNAKQTRGRGRLDTRTRLWSLHLGADGLDVEAWGGRNLDLVLAAEGDDRQALVSELRVVEGQKAISATGQLSFRQWDLQGVRLVADWSDAEGPMELPATARSMGDWHVEAEVMGRVWPLQVEITGQATGQNVPLGTRAIKQVEIPVRAEVEAERIRLTTQPFRLLEGQWQLTAAHERSARRTHVSATVDDVSLDAAAGAVGLPVSSRGHAHAQIALMVPDFDLQQAAAMGSWSAADLSSRPFEVERAGGKLRIADGLVRIEDILLEHGDSRARANLEFRLDDPQVLSLDLETEGWTVPLEDRPLALRAEGRANLRVNLATKRADGEVRGAGEVLWKGQRFVVARASTQIMSRTLSVKELDAEILGGSVRGEATIPLDRWRHSTVRLAWQGIGPKLLEPWVPQFARFEGRMSGSLVVEPADPQTRPPEPVRLALDARMAEGRFGPARIEGCHILGYAGERRWLIDEADFRVLGGQFNARTRLSMHQGERFSSLVADFNDLDLDQIARWIDPNAQGYVGRVSGQATLLSPFNLALLSGTARVRLTQSDLAGNGVVRTLYNTLNLHFGPQEPAGEGEVEIRLEGPTVLVPSFEYFNRGVEIRGAGRVLDINRGPASAVDGYAVASPRVLKGLPLPGGRTLDRLLTTFQKDAASVKIGGTIEDVEVEVVPLPVILDSFRRLLWAQLRQ